MSAQPATIDVVPGARLDDPTRNSGCVHDPETGEMAGVWFWQSRTEVVAFLFERDPYRVALTGLDRKRLCERHTSPVCGDRAVQAPLDL